MTLHKIDVARTQIDTAIELFLSDKDFLASLTLAGAAEDILGKFLDRKGEKSMLQNLHEWYQQTSGDPIEYGEFAKKANFTRNSLKHATNAAEDELEVFRWEAVQMLMRALYNYKVLVGEPTEKMLAFNSWLQAHRGAYEEME